MSERLSSIEAIMWRTGHDATLRMTVGTLMVTRSVHRPAQALLERLEAATERRRGCAGASTTPTALRTRARHGSTNAEFRRGHHVRTMAVATPGRPAPAPRSRRTARAVAVRSRSRAVGRDAHRGPRGRPGGDLPPRPPRAHRRPRRRLTHRTARRRGAAHLARRLVEAAVGKRRRSAATDPTARPSPKRQARHGQHQHRPHQRGRAGCRRASPRASLFTLARSTLSICSCAAIQRASTSRARCPTSSWSPAVRSSPIPPLGRLTSRFEMLSIPDAREAARGPGWQPQRSARRGRELRVSASTTSSVGAALLRAAACPRRPRSTATTAASAATGSHRLGWRCRPSAEHPGPHFGVVAERLRGARRRAGRCRIAGERRLGRRPAADPCAHARRSTPRPTRSTSSRRRCPGFRTERHMGGALIEECFPLRPPPGLPRRTSARSATATASTSASCSTPTRSPTPQLLVECLATAFTRVRTGGSPPTHATPKAHALAPLADRAAEPHERSNRRPPPLRRDEVAPHCSTRSRTDATAILQSVVNEVAPAVVNAIDVDEVVERVDIQAVLARVDVEALIDRVDLNELLDEGRHRSPARPRRHRTGARPARSDRAGSRSSTAIVDADRPQPRDRQARPRRDHRPDRPRPGCSNASTSNALMERTELGPDHRERAPAWRARRSTVLGAPASASTRSCTAGWTEGSGDRRVGARGPPLLVSIEAREAAGNDRRQHPTTRSTSSRARTPGIVTRCHGLRDRCAGHPRVCSPWPATCSTTSRPRSSARTSLFAMRRGSRRSPSPRGRSSTAPTRSPPMVAHSAWRSWASALYAKDGRRL